MSMPFEVLDKCPDFIENNNYFHPQDYRNVDLPGDGFKMPGIIDTHCHGGFGWDFSFGDPEKINQMLDNMLVTGLTGVMATIITSSEEQTLKAIKDIVKVIKTREVLPIVHGIYLEGPFLAKEKCGSHQVDLLKNPSIELLKKYQEAAEGLIKVVTVAPELPGAIDFIKEAVKMRIRVALGHSVADYKTTAKAVEAGATIVTHLFNAMPQLHHREANILTYVLSHRDLAIELIADCEHICPEMLAFIFSFYEASQIMLISDSMATTGLKDGEYDFYNTKIVKKGTRCNLKSGGFFGGATTLPQSLKIMSDKTYMSWGLIGTSAWRTPINHHNLESRETEVYFDTKMNWICSALDHEKWFVKKS